MKTYEYDYVVVGGGLAGINTAYHLSRLGRVALLSLATLEDSNSYFAQGGMAAVTAPSDSPSEHLEDTLVAGAGLCDLEAVRILTEKAPKRVDDLIGMGMQFDTKDGELELGLEGGHHQHRILHAGGDATGRQITTFMIKELATRENVDVFEEHALLELIVRDNHCYGIWVENIVRGEEEAFYAKSVVIATGGAAALYRPTTNPHTALGDGLSIAYQAGAVVRDMEFIQFHPTALHVKGAPAFLISEAVRGEGAYLLNPDGERFMLGRHPMAELAPRDVVAREIYSEMQKFDVESMTLSLKHLNADVIRKRFPSITAELASFGLDLTQEIPIAPAAHYTVGGLLVDLNGCTSIDGLYAVGEVASTGVMGANRLASNSLVECVVFSKNIAAHIEKCDYPFLPTEERALIPCKMEKSLTFSDQKWMEEHGNKLMKRLGKLLMKRAGIVRSAKKLNKALIEITDTMQQLEELVNASFAVRQVYNRYLVGNLIVLSAHSREESRGGHFRKDFPETLSEDLAYHTLIKDNRISKVKHGK
ncbi:L-aspartate oxidase [Porphyromonas levii]|uniref:L-aspartate oxidase n=1 Tax=Porphyromonas levii TaxID=28114 RepID=UPI001B8D8D6C|nr:L-aspartate oxidase [Porphyromonas levii]MBR8763200.1 L-aspartate oxidase [Porphyromonas levii]MBR8769472.1 L-aspartate oxidase [Porphyromonas levii]